MRTIKLLFVFALSIFLLPSQAQDSQGNDFWIMFPKNYTGTPTLDLFITSTTNTTGTVNIPGLSFTQNFSTTAGTITKVTIPSTAEVNTNDAVTNKGVHITSVDDITVYGFSVQSYTTDAFLSFPVDALGMDYMLLTYEALASSYPSQLGIVAAETGTTTVTITPTETVGARTAGVPYNITLTQGQTYLLGATPYPADLSGSLISANKKIAVFGAVKCVNIPSGYSACDFIIEQIPPLTTWGKEFATVPLKTRSGDTYRVIASENSTQVQVDGANVATLNKGDMYETIMTGYHRISADKPVLVGQYSNGQTYDNALADPFFLLVPPTEQYLTNYVVNTGTPGVPTNYINIVSQTSQTGGVQVDGVTVSAGAWNAIPGTTLSGAQITTTTAGQHSVTSTFPIGVFVYGFGNYDSYGYLGGQSFSPVATVVR